MKQRTLTRLIITQAFVGTTPGDGLSYRPGLAGYMTLAAVRQYRSERRWTREPHELFIPP